MIPRDQNEEADALTNFDYRFFDPEKRIEVDINALGFKLLPELFEFGEQNLTELAAEKAKAKEKKERRMGGRDGRPQEEAG